jgi:hypothetical protein
MNEIPQQIPNQQPVEPQPQPEQQVPTEPAEPVVAPQQPQTKWLFLVLALVVALAAYAGVAYWQGMWPFSPSEEVAEEIIVEESPTPTSVADTTVGWRTYTDSGIGLNFKYPTTWTVNNYDKSPNLLIYSSLISSLSDVCGELGTCQQYELDNKKIIEDGSMSGIISFDGGKGSLIATCSGNEGGSLIPTPFYKFKFYKGDRLYEITLNDLPTELSTDSDCNRDQHIQTLVESIPNSISGSEYRTYNDLLTLIKQTLILE